MKAEPLRAARKAQRAAARHGFDWPRLDAGVWDKLVEEIHELRAVTRRPSRAAEELGDLLFMAVNLSRHLRVDAGRALAAATRKFERRFAYVMRHAQALPPRGDRRRLERMEQLWRQAKRREQKK